MVYRRVLVSRSTFSKLPHFANFRMVNYSPAIKVGRRSFWSTEDHSLDDKTISDVSTEVRRIPQVHLQVP